MKTRNLIIQGTVDEVAAWKAWLADAIDDPKKDKAGASLLRQLQGVRDGGLVDAAPLLEIPEKPAKGQPAPPAEPAAKGTNPAAAQAQLSPSSSSPAPPASS